MTREAGPYVLNLFFTVGTSFAISGSDLLHEGRARQASQDVGEGTVLREGYTHALPTGGQSHPATGDGQPKKPCSRGHPALFLSPISEPDASRAPSSPLQARSQQAPGPKVLLFDRPCACHPRRAKRGKGIPSQARRRHKARAPFTLPAENGRLPGEALLKHRTQRWICTFGIPSDAFSWDVSIVRAQNRVHFSARCSREQADTRI